MRGAPPFQIDIGANVAWRTAIAGLCAAAVGCIAAWLWFRETPSAIAGVVGALLAAAVAAAATLLRSAPHRLRFDGSGWWLECGAIAQLRPGRVQVAIDLGGFMLLRFRPEGARLARWLALERRVGHDAWHLLRCAVYSPRSGQAPPAVDAPFH